MLIKAKNIADAHKKSCKAIFEDGIEIITEDGEVTIEYPTPLIVMIENPLDENNISEFNNFGEKQIDAYTKQLCEGTDNDFIYTYNDRLVNHVVFDSEDCKLKNVNQIDWAVNKLKNEPNSRRVVLMLRNTSIDLNNENPPCWTVLQLMIRNGELQSTLYFRSHDYLSAFNNNIYAITKLLEIVCKQIDENLTLGLITIVSNSAHIYYKRDSEELKKFKLWCYK